MSREMHWAEIFCEVEKEIKKRKEEINLLEIRKHKNNTNPASSIFLELEKKAKNFDPLQIKSQIVKYSKTKTNLSLDCITKEKDVLNKMQNIEVFDLEIELRDCNQKLVLSKAFKTQNILFGNMLLNLSIDLVFFAAVCFAFLLIAPMLILLISPFLFYTLLLILPVVFTAMLFPELFFETIDKIEAFSSSTTIESYKNIKIPELHFLFMELEKMNLNPKLLLDFLDSEQTTLLVRLQCSYTDLFEDFICR